MYWEVNAGPEKSLTSQGTFFCHPFWMQKQTWQAVRFLAESRMQNLGTSNFDLGCNILYAVVCIVHPGQTKNHHVLGAWTKAVWMLDHGQSGLSILPLSAKFENCSWWLYVHGAWTSIHCRRHVNREGTGIAKRTPSLLFTSSGSFSWHLTQAEIPLRQPLLLVVRLFKIVQNFVSRILKSVQECPRYSTNGILFSSVERKAALSIRDHKWTVLMLSKLHPRWHPWSSTSSWNWTACRHNSNKDSCHLITGKSISRSIFYIWKCNLLLEVAFW